MPDPPDATAGIVFGAIVGADPGAFLLLPGNAEMNHVVLAGLVAIAEAGDGRPGDGS